MVVKHLRAASPLRRPLTSAKGLLTFVVLSLVKQVAQLVHSIFLQ